VLSPEQFLTLLKEAMSNWHTSATYKHSRHLTPTSSARYSLNEQVSSPEQFLKLMKQAMSNRRTSATYKNDASSRSHAVCKIRSVNLDYAAAEDGVLYVVDLGT
jgi:hypothetical protein